MKFPPINLYFPFYDDDDSFDFEFGNAPILEESKEPCVCIKCDEIYPYSKPNQKDGKFKCYSCREFYNQ